MSTFLFVDLHAYVDVDADDDQVADDVERADSVQHVGIVEWHLLARLHHHQDDDQVSAVKLSCQCLPNVHEDCC